MEEPYECPPPQKSFKALISNLLREADTRKMAILMKHLNDMLQREQFQLALLRECYLPPENDEEHYIEGDEHYIEEDKYFADER